MSDILSDSRRKYVTISELADYLGIGKTSAYDLVNAGEIRAKRFGKRNVRIHVDEVKRYIEESDWNPYSPPENVSKIKAV